MAGVIVGRTYSVYSDTEFLFDWEINNFRFINVVDCLISPEFPTKYENEVIEWHFNLYSKGIKSDKSEEHLELYLFCSAEIKAGFSVMIVNNKGEPSQTLTVNEYLFKKGQGAGFPNFISRSFIQNPANDILDNGKLVIKCRVTCLSNSETKSPFISCHRGAKRLKTEDNYESLLSDSEFSDVSLVAEGKAVKVHKCILAKRSVVFAAMFGNETKEKQESVIEIVDIKYDVLMEMLRFVYSGKINNIDKLASQLAIAADKYALVDLKIMCEETMRGKLSPDNVIEYLLFADRLQMDELKKNAVEFIIEKASQIMKKPEFDLLPIHLVRSICRKFADNIR